MVRRQYILAVMSRKDLEFPVPDPEAQRHSQRLADLIRAEIEAGGGWISFARYMELALYAPLGGYYTGGAQKFGREGDFVTAPEMTPLFARALAHQVAEILAGSGGHLLEFGAGSGQLAADLLSALHTIGAPVRSYGILELSAELRQRQAATLARQAVGGIAVHWLERLPEKFSGVVIANEVLDAMPVHRVVWRGGNVVEQGVGLDGTGRFVFRERPVGGALLSRAETIAAECALPPDYESEVALIAPGWVEAWRRRLERGALILADYGCARREYYHARRQGGTLRCHYCHRGHDDPFFRPGLQDITADVDFTAIAEAGVAAGLEVYGYAGQGRFLLNCGLMDELAALLPGSTPYRRAARAVQQLLLPQGMGDRFKVMILGRGLEFPLLGFQEGDWTERL